MRFDLVVEHRDNNGELISINHIKDNTIIGLENQLKPIINHLRREFMRSGELENSDMDGVNGR